MLALLPVSASMVMLLSGFFPQNAKKKMYGCTEAFLADAKWILHNCIIYNGGEWLGGFQGRECASESVAHSLPVLC